MKEEEMDKVAELIYLGLSIDNTSNGVREQVIELMNKFQRIHFSIDDKEKAYYQSMEY
jgi:hypothetical protein